MWLFGDGDVVSRTRRLKERASKFIRKKKFEEALLVYCQINEIEPRDTYVWLKRAEILGRLGRKAESAEIYGRLAEQFTDEGFVDRAAACLRCILSLTPKRAPEIHLKLAAMQDSKHAY